MSIFFLSSALLLSDLVIEGRVNRLCRRRKVRDASPSCAFKYIREDEVILFGATTLLQRPNQGLFSFSKKKTLNKSKQIYKVLWWQVIFHSSFRIYKELGPLPPTERQGTYQTQLSWNTKRKQAHFLRMRTQCTPTNEVIVLSLSICGTGAFDFLSRVIQRV